MGINRLLSGLRERLGGEGLPAIDLDTIEEIPTGKGGIAAPTMSMYTPRTQVGVQYFTAKRVLSTSDEFEIFSVSEYFDQTKYENKTHHLARVPALRYALEILNAEDRLLQKGWRTNLLPVLATLKSEGKAYTFSPILRAATQAVFRQPTL